MTPEQKALVQSTFKMVAPISEQAAQIFYTRLFELDPDLRPLFKGDITEQGRKLMQTLAFVVSGLDRLETIVPAVEDLGRRHVGYNIREEHYNTVGEALLWTLDKGLGAEFTLEAKEAWGAAYGVLSSVMKNAAATVGVE